jgi:beta-lactamase regulating signal transducer with metallopeptidase domain
MQTILQRIDARVRRWLLVGAALLAPLAPAALMPETFASAILKSIESISVERIAGIAAVTNALTLMP